MSNKDNSHRKMILYRNDPYCHWCGVKTIICHMKKGSNKTNPRMATVDHIVSKNFSGYSVGFENTVIACHECNHIRNENERKLLPHFHKYDFLQAPKYMLTLLSGKI